MFVKPMLPPIPDDEPERLRQLRELMVLDSASEPVFESLALLASQTCGVPIALVSLVDGGRQWFKAKVGLPGVDETPRELAFCAHAINGDALFEVPDAAADPRFRDNPLVTGAPDIRFYAGAPLVLPGGQRVGTLCVIDRQPRRLEPAQAALLQSLARVASEVLVMRRDLILRSLDARSAHEHALRETAAFLRRTGRVAGVGGWQLELATSALTWSEQTRNIHEVAPDHVPTLAGAIDFYAPEARPVIQRAVKLAMDEGTAWDLELPFITAKGRPIWVRAQGEAEFEDGLPVRLVGAFQDITERKRLEQQVAEDERFLRLVTDRLPQRIAYLDRSLRYRFVNQAHVQRLGLPREQILGRSSAEITGEAPPQPLRDALRAALQGQPQQVEFEEPSRAGGAKGTLRLDCQVLPDLSERGEVRGLFTTTADITERSRGEQALRELTAIIEKTTDFVVQTDWRGDITYMNPAARSATGLAADAPLAGLNFAAFSTDATNRHFADVIVAAVNASGAWVGETTVRVPGGAELPVSQIVIAHRDAQGRVARYSSVMRDISAEAAARRALQLQTATLRAVTEATPAIVAVVGSDLRYRFVNSAFERWIGMPRERVVGRTLAEVLGADDLERSRPWIERVMAGETVQFERVNHKRGSGRNLAMTYSPLVAQGDVIDGFIGVGQDITSHRQEENRLLRLSESDALTGLLNRAGFERRLQLEVQAGRGGQTALLYVDLDHFKPVNDVHGHAAGDQVLQQFAQRVQAVVRPSDAVARLGGDEFALLLFGVRESGHAHAVAEKVIAAAGTVFDVGGRQLHIGASVGVAFGVASQDAWSDLVQRADNQLYRAKEAGRGRHAGTTDWVADTGPVDDAAFDDRRSHR